MNRTAQEEHRRYTLAMSLIAAVLGALYLGHEVMALWHHVLGLYGTSLGRGIEG